MALTRRLLSGVVCRFSRNRVGGVSAERPEFVLLFRPARFACLSARVSDIGACRFGCAAHLDGGPTSRRTPRLGGASLRVRLGIHRRCRCFTPPVSHLPLTPRSADYPMRRLCRCHLSCQDDLASPSLCRPEVATPSLPTTIVSPLQAHNLVVGLESGSASDRHCSASDSQASSVGVYMKLSRSHLSTCSPRPACSDFQR